MSSELTYNIFYDNYKDPYYNLISPNGDQLAFSRYNWQDCKITLNGLDLIKIFINEYKPLTIALNFMYDTRLNNMVFTKSSGFEYKLKGSYLNDKVEQINWKWISMSWSSNFILVDKLNRHRLLAKIKGFTLKKERTGKLVISAGIPLEYHNVIVTTACLVFKVNQDANIRKLNQ